MPIYTYVGPAALEFAGERLNVNVSREGDGAIAFRIIANANDPRAVERAHRYMSDLIQKGGGDGEKYRVTSRVRYHGRLAQIGDLRTAFLIGFAALGYRYAFDRRLAPVRKQIFLPDERIISGWTMTLTEPDAPPYLVLITKTPRSVLVKLHDTGVLLPWLDGPRDFYSKLNATYSREERIQLSGRLLPWPTTLEMALDFQEPEGCAGEH